MLVLSRKLDEVISITLPDGTVIQVKVIEMGHGRVRLGFEAPPAVKILRAEVLDRDAAEPPGG